VAGKSDVAEDEQRVGENAEDLNLERARLYEALRASEEKLRLALKAARAATWTLDLATMTTIRDPSYRALCGGGTVVTADFASIHPDDRAIAREAFARTLTHGTPYEPEVRVRRDDGSYLWVRAHGRVISGPSGAPRQLAGVVVDIDEAKHASLRAEAERRINDTLHRLGSSFARELDHGRLIKIITDEVTAVVEGSWGAFVTSAEGQLRFLHVTGENASAAPAETVLRDAGELLATAFAHREVVRTDDRPAPTTAEGSGLRSYLVVPISDRDNHLFGGLLLAHPTRARFDEEHERLGSRVAQLASVALENARLYQTVREQKEQLEAAMERVQQADQRKDEFLAVLGHELRNPLAPILTALSLMDLSGEPAFRKERDVIRRQLHHLTRLVDDLLDVSRVSRGKLQLDKSVVEIASVLAKAVEMVSPLLQKKKQELLLDVPDEGLSVYGDPARLAQAFQNLLVNAAKYSDVGSPVSLAAWAAGERVVVAIRDQGIGIPSELMPRLFDLFVQGDRTLARAEGGLGLGLAIAHRLCELHGGAISVESEGTGRGSTFTVTLPRVALAPTLVGPRAAVAAPAPLVAAHPKRVLVVDDNVDAAMSLQELLVARGHDAAIAHDGEAALALADRFHPRVAVLDVGLPLIDGYELASRLRASRSREELRLIALTGYGQESDRVRAHQAGFDHHLVKPVSFDLLVRLLEA